MNILKRNFVKKEQEVFLRTFVYKTGEYTKLDKIMSEFWNSLLKYVPTYLAPNVITLLGLFFSLLCPVTFFVDPN